MSGQGSSFAQAGFQILSGVEALKAHKEESKSLGKQSSLAVSEGKKAGDLRQEQVDEFGKRQRLQFLKSGVRLEGTPLAVLAETAEKGKEQADAIRDAGKAKGGLFRSRAKISRRGGRGALIGGLAQASGTLAGIE